MLVDDYNHVDSKIFYIPENIPSANTHDAFEEQFSEGCVCKTICTIENQCFCILRSGAHYKTDTEHLHDATIICSDTAKPVYECNKNCKCTQFCNHKLVQFGPRADLEIKLCDTVNGQCKGLGLITLKRIKKGSFVCEYAGEIINETDAMRRHDQNEKSKRMNYIFGVIEHFGRVCMKMFIDPSTFGNIGRYINHSCDPNSELLTVRVNTVIPKLCIFAKDDIQAGAEITFDYGRDSNQNEDGKMARVKCLCGSKNCRQYIPLCNYN
ncbi:probable histone-lysine N-methyltransferase set-23 [Photinus pyralis]|uniref:Histone-lysine N-methyltransferase n=1 Tax=Photinus pyralis TaxID=7054 RepID=A0A1Y1KPA9_PHOPY|nr:probable histone-lysine N-methyltransferase set-23 [Photinus pyralis]